MAVYNQSGQQTKKEYEPNGRTYSWTCAKNIAENITVIVIANSDFWNNNFEKRPLVTGW